MKNIWSECWKGCHCTSAHWNSHQFWQWERCCWVMKMIKNTNKQGLLAGDETDWSWRPSKHGLDWYGGLLLLCGNRLVLMNDRPTWSPKITYISTYNIQHSYKYTNQIDWSYKWMTEHLKGQECSFSNLCPSLRLFVQLFTLCMQVKRTQRQDWSGFIYARLEKAWLTHLLSYLDEWTHHKEAWLTVGIF